MIHYDHTTAGKNSNADILDRRQLFRAAAVLGVGSAGGGLSLAQAQAPAVPEPEMVYPANFKRFKVDTSAGARIAGVIGGVGPPVLLMHGTARR